MREKSSERVTCETFSRNPTSLLLFFLIQSVCAATRARTFKFVSMKSDEERWRKVITSSRLISESFLKFFRTDRRSLFFFFYYLEKGCKVSISDNWFYAPWFMITNDTKRWFWGKNRANLTPWAPVYSLVVPIDMCYPFICWVASLVVRVDNEFPSLSEKLGHVLYEIFVRVRHHSVNVNAQERIPYRFLL